MATSESGRDAQESGGGGSGADPLDRAGDDGHLAAAAGVVLTSSSRGMLLAPEHREVGVDHLVVAPAG